MLRTEVRRLRSVVERRDPHGELRFPLGVDQPKPRVRRRDALTAAGRERGRLVREGEPHAAVLARPRGVGS